MQLHNNSRGKEKGSSPPLHWTLDEFIHKDLFPFFCVCCFPTRRIICSGATFPPSKTNFQKSAGSTFFSVQHNPSAAGVNGHAKAFGSSLSFSPLPYDGGWFFSRGKIFVSKTRGCIVVTTFPVSYSSLLQCVWFLRPLFFIVFVVFWTFL